MSEMFMNMHAKQCSTPRFISNVDEELSADGSIVKDDNTNASIDDEDAGDTINNILRLKLKKPTAWKWELTTSRSSSNIALPKIFLFDNKGDLLAEASGQEEQIFRDKQNSMNNKRAEKRKLRKIQKVSKASLENQLKELQIVEVAPSTSSSIDSRSTSMKDTIFEVKFPSSTASSFNGKQPPSTISSFDMVDPPLARSSFTFKQPPSSTSSSGPREKKKHRQLCKPGRALMHSESILERFSAFKGSISSPDLTEESDGCIRPRYILRSSKAGTLVVAADSFYLKNRKFRRRPKLTSSSEHIQNETNTNGNSNRFSPQINFRKQKTLRANKYLTIQSVSSSDETSWELKENEFDCTKDNENGVNGGLTDNTQENNKKR